MGANRSSSSKKRSTCPLFLIPHVLGHIEPVVAQVTPSQIRGVAKRVALALVRAANQVIAIIPPLMERTMTGEEGMKHSIYTSLTPLVRNPILIWRNLMTLTSRLHSMTFLKGALRRMTSATQAAEP
jgi:hypothetical protein